MTNPFRKAAPASLHAQLGRIIETAPTNLALKDPQTGAFPALTNEQMQWLGRADALVAETFGIGGNLAFQNAVKNLSQPIYRAWAVSEIMRELYRALATVELELPASASGSFIPAGNSFDALKAVQRIFEQAASDLLIVDPYMDEKVLTDFAVLAAENVSLRLLSDEASVKPSLAPALKHWQAQYGSKRPASARLASPRSLHDRIVVVDNQTVYAVGQSFKDLAARAPTSFVRADPETAALKVQAYSAVWSAAKAL